MPARLSIKPAQLQRLLDVLVPFGFSPKKVEVSPDGTLTLHGEATPEAKRDVLAEWEAGRATRLH